MEVLGPSWTSKHNIIRFLMSLLWSKSSLILVTLPGLGLKRGFMSHLCKPCLAEICEPMSPPYVVGLVVPPSIKKKLSVTTFFYQSTEWFQFLYNFEMNLPTNSKMWRKTNSLRWSRQISHWTGLPMPSSRHRMAPFV